MTDDDTSDSQTLTGGDITQYRALVARISFLSQDRPDLKFASMQVCCAMAKPALRDMERVKRIGRYLAGKPRARCWSRWQQSGELEVYSDADWGGDTATRRSVSAGAIMWQVHTGNVVVSKERERRVPLTRRVQDTAKLLKVQKVQFIYEAVVVGVPVGTVQLVQETVAARSRCTSSTRWVTSLRACGYDFQQCRQFLKTEQIPHALFLLMYLLLCKDRRRLCRHRSCTTYQFQGANPQRCHRYATLTGLRRSPGGMPWRRLRRCPRFPLSTGRVPYNRLSLRICASVAADSG